jgi:flagellar biosynthesis protein FlhF
MQEAIERFRQIPLTGCIFTKIDECMSMGEILSVAIQNALPIGYLSEGQRVPEDLRVADADYLVQKSAQLMSERNISQPNWFTDDSFQPIYK